MNEIDAHATDVHVDLSSDRKTIHIYGNGRGFGTYEEAVKRFGDLSFDHQDADEVAMNRRYGTYGLGRAQILAFGHCVWTSFNLKIECNLFGGADRDVPFDITQYKESQFDGCRVDITLKDELSFSDNRHLRQEIIAMSKYLPARLHINGEQQNSNRDEIKWTKRTENLGFILNNSMNGIYVYNDGIYIRHYPYRQFGVSGDVTSLDATFKVNVARNDILQTTCPLWVELKSLLKPFSEKLAAKASAKLSDAERSQLFVQFLKGEHIPSPAKINLQLRDVSGKWCSFSKLLKSKVLSVPDVVHSPKGEKINRLPNTLILSKLWLNELGFDSVEGFIKATIEALDYCSKTNPNHYYLYYSDLIKEIKIRDFSSLVAAFDDNDLQIIPTQDLTPTLKVKRLAIQKLSDRIAFSCRLKPRHIYVGMSHVAGAWTDGFSYICVKREVVEKAFSSGFTSLFKLLTILLHEYTHDNPEHTEGHSFEFYKSFHDSITVHNISVINILQESMLVYFNERKKAGLSYVDSELDACVNTFTDKLYKILNDASFELNSTDGDASTDKSAA